MPLQFCPISFTLFPSIKWGGKTYSILMHIGENSDTSSGGIDHRQSPLLSCVPMTSIIRPHGCWLMHSRQVLLSSTSPSISDHPLFIILLLSCSPPLLCFNTYMSIPVPSFPPPLLSPFILFLLPSLPSCFPYISVPYSFPPVIRSWWPPAGVNGGENQPWVSRCISSLRCSLASNEDGHCQNPVSRCARHTWGHNEQCI